MGDPGWELPVMTRDGERVLQAVESTVLCVSCIQSQTGLDLDRTLEAMASVDLLRVAWRCPSCQRRGIVLARA